jgi:transcriptional regulator with XRE-family HTH domain
MDAARVTREARGRAGLTQRELARAAGMPQPAVARIETGDVVPRVDTLVRLLTVCGVALTVDQRPPESVDRAKIRALLRLTPRQRVLGLERHGSSRFRPLEAVGILTGRRVRFVLIGEIAARIHGAPVTPSSVGIALQPEWPNSERLARALEAMAGTSRPTKGLPTGTRDLRGRREVRTRLGAMGCWWSPAETYRRLEGAAAEMPLSARPVLVASIDDVIEGWRGSGDELELLAAVREEMDLKAVRRAQQRRPSRTRGSQPQ